MAAAPCKYCAGGTLPEGLRPMRRLPSSALYIVDDARHPGRCVVAAAWHVRELFQLTPSQRDAFMADVNAVAAAVAEVTQADKINIGLYGDLSDHLHAHVVPKRRGTPPWGDTFALQPLRPDVLDDALAQRIARALDAPRP